jgi:translocation and assembly module TamB
MSDPTATSQSDPHEQRIRELRQRRRAALRWLAVRGSLVAGVLTLLLAGFAYWLLTSVGGRDLLMAQIVARLPANASLSWRAVEGPLSGPLTLRDVRFTYERIVFTAQRVYLDPAIRPLLGRRLRLDALQIGNATLEIPESKEPFQLPQWPDVLPEITPPLELQADDVRVDGFLLTRQGEKLIDIRTLRAGSTPRQGKLHVERLSVDSDRGRLNLRGDYAPREDYRADITASAVLAAADGRTPARIGLVARGDLTRMDVALSGHVPGPLHASLVLRGRDIPKWRLRAVADAIDLGLVTGAQASGDDEPLALQFDADGVGGSALLSGQLKQGDFQRQGVAVEGESRATGVGPSAARTGGLRRPGDVERACRFNDPENARFRLAANARGLAWGGPTDAEPDAVSIGADADLGFAGTLQAWAAIGRADLVRDGEHAKVEFDGRGNDARMTLRTLKAKMPSGSLDGRGVVTWKPALGWSIDATLAGFDPGYFATDWRGAVDGKLATQGSTRSDGGLELSVDARELGGRLRNRRSRVAAALRCTAPAAPAATRRMKATWRWRSVAATSMPRARSLARLDVDAKFAPLVLSDLLPGGAGSLRGTLRLSGPRTAPDVTADLVGSGLKYGDYQATSLTAKGRLPWQRGSGAIAVHANGLQVGLPLSSLTLDARGAVESLQLQGEARGDIGVLTLSGNAARQGNAWQGALASLQLVPAKGASWRLQEARGSAGTGATAR